MPYEGIPQESARDRVRLLVGDISTSTSGQWLADPDYDWFLASASNEYIAAQQAANTLAAKFTGVGGDNWIEHTVGDLTIKRSDSVAVAEEFKKLSKHFGQMAVAGTSPYAGGLSVSDKSNVQLDTDRVRPSFTRSLFDNKAAMIGNDGTT